MPRPLAFFLTIAFVVYLFRRDSRERPNVTGALWIPLIWMLISGSRFVSQWLSLGGVGVYSASLEEGSPLDRVVFLALQIAGIYVLKTRQVSLSEVVRYNRW